MYLPQPCPRCSAPIHNYGMHCAACGYSPPDPRLPRAAKAVAEARQHGCHYAEGTCAECHEIAAAVLKSIS